MNDYLSARPKPYILLCLMVLGIFLIIVSGPEVLPKKLIWNASSSIPIGLYIVEKRMPVRGDIVLVNLPKWVRIMADQRGYLPSNVPALKRVSALSGDTVCRFGGTIFVNGSVKAKARSLDDLARNMPVWSGCKLLGEGQVFLLADHPSSFDGRYFGVTEVADILGVAKPIWISLN
ncbi:S26 family signal peptidase [uncultured Sneathiella sp.]|jgi:conjugative transfer signal peptidase TraF|uniref:S26 family signal peptidase n=1 Tax=uncultured Sneathiella sp. TaxID=879315 RepID=UPI0030DD560E|tara:strand:- start:1728 stop:2255 length:528 start_codon:yes stop_codon:yes gene_type:complete